MLELQFVRLERKMHTCLPVDIEIYGFMVVRKFKPLGQSSSTAQQTGTGCCQCTFFKKIPPFHMIGVLQFRYVNELSTFPLLPDLGVESAAF